MTHPVTEEPDLDDLSNAWAPEQSNPEATPPACLSASELFEMNIPAPEMLIEKMLPRCGATLVNGAAKSGKTIFCAQTAIAVASGTALFGNYRVLRPGATMMIEQDDPGATASIREILLRSPVPARDIPFYMIPKVPFSFGPDFTKWAEDEIAKRSLNLLICDSYTALRPSRKKGSDIVKVEQEELAQLNDLGKRTNCAIVPLHHITAGKSAMDWTIQAAGTFAMTAATEAQLHISRFPDMNGAPERLMRVRGRHGEDIEMVLRFRTESLDFEHVYEGSAATEWAHIQELRRHFGSNPFTPKNVIQETGTPRATAHRLINRLCGSGAVEKCGYGEYRLSRDLA